MRRLKQPKKIQNMRRLKESKKIVHTYWSAVKVDGFGVHVSLQNGSVRIC